MRKEHTCWLLKIMKGLKSGWLWPFLEHKCWLWYTPRSVVDPTGRNRGPEIRLFTVVQIFVNSTTLDNLNGETDLTQVFEGISLLRRLMKGRMRRGRAEESSILILHHWGWSFCDSHSSFKALSWNESTWWQEGICSWWKKKEILLSINHGITEVLLIELKILLMQLLDLVQKLLCISLTLLYSWVELLILLIIVHDLLIDAVWLSQISL